MANKIRPTIKLRYGTVNEPIRIPIQVLIQDAQKTFLTNDFASGVSSLTVQNIYGIAVNKILFVGKPGVDNSEIIKTHAATAPTGSTVTLASATTQAHTNSDYVYVIPFDQVELSYATSLTGAKSVLTTMKLDVDTETKYNDTTVTVGYYFARFKNSITNTYSDYSDGVPIGSYALNTARYIIDSALGEINKPTSEVFSDEFAFQQINNCQMEVVRELKRWSWMQVFGATTQSSIGNWRIQLPSDIDDSHTNKAIWNFSIGNDPAMTWVDMSEWKNITYDVAFSYLTTPLGIGDGTITLSSTSDFEESGTIQIAGNEISYTANNQSTGVLTLASVSTLSYPANTDVFQNASLGTPLYYTIFAGYVWHYPLVDSLHDQMDYKMDYYSTLSSITKDTDTISVPDAVLVKDYLISKFIKRMDTGKDSNASVSAFQNYAYRLKKLKQTEVSNHKIILKPRYNNYSQLEAIDGDSKYTRLQGFIHNV